VSRTLRVSDQAKIDLLEIWRYIAEDDLRAADRMIEKFVDAYPLLLSMPFIGRSCNELSFFRKAR